MRTVLIPSVVAFALVAGCNTFETVEEACLDESPGQQFITKPGDVEIFQRGNCYRRLAKRPRVVVNKQMQEAIEAHANWIDLNGPDVTRSISVLRNEIASTEGFTGTTVFDRLDNAGFGKVSDGSEMRSYVEEVLEDLAAGKEPRVQSSKPYGCSVKYAK